MEEKIIDIQGLTKRFGTFTAVNNISFSVGKGEIFGFLGANGAGKSTAIRMLCGLSRPTAGSGTVAGFDIIRQYEQIKRHIGYMSQKFSLYDDLTPMENIYLFGGIYGMSRKDIAEKSSILLDKLGISNKKKQLVNALPLGEKQKLAFSVSIFHNPQIVFLDEPTGGVDPASRRKFWEMIYETASGGITVFVTTHYMDEAEYCNRISIMSDGEIKALGSPRQLKNEYSAASIDEVFRKIATKGQREL